MTATLSTASPLLAAASPDLDAHERMLGPVPWFGDAGKLIPVLKEAGLTGRGGAGFPTWRKLAAVAVGGRTVLIANGAEGEPAARKDRALLHQAPHLVLDGLQLVAEAVGASRVYLYAPEYSLDAVRAALAPRRATDRHTIELVTAPDTFIAGEESAAVAAVEGRAALPRDKVRLVVESGVRGQPTLVQNVETLAHIALIARGGPQWFRGRGTPDEPGTFLATLSGAVRQPGVYEVPYGVPLGELVRLAGGAVPAAAAGGLVGHAGGTRARITAALVGGYHGTWVPYDPALLVSRAGLRPFGATPGAGVVVALPAGVCPLLETVGILSYLAGQSAGQCGPCRNGLPALASTFWRLAHMHRDTRLPREVERLAALVTGRGACHHPDGSARFAASALRVFADDVKAHLGGRCARA